MKRPAVRTEVALLTGSATFGLILGTAYWFLTYEVVGAALLLGFGAGSAFAAILTRRTLAEAAAEAGGGEAAPRPGWGPIGIGAGVGACGLGLAFGPWIILIGMLILSASGATWLAAAVAEYDRSV